MYLKYFFFVSLLLSFNGNCNIESSTYESPAENRIFSTTANDIKILIDFIQSLEIEKDPQLMGVENNCYSCRLDYKYSSSSEKYQIVLARATMHGSVQGCLYELNLLIKKYTLDLIVLLLDDYENLYNRHKIDFLNLQDTAALLKDLKIIFSKLHYDLPHYVFCSHYYSLPVQKECLEISSILRNLASKAKAGISSCLHVKNYRNEKSNLERKYCDPIVCDVYEWLTHKGTFHFFAQPKYLQ